MKPNQCEQRLLEVLARLGREDRELYRMLRSEAWALVVTAHGKQDAEQRGEWLRNAS